MCISKTITYALSLSIFALGTGCNKSEDKAPPAAKPTASAPAQEPAPKEPAFALHWIGMKRLAAEPGAAEFLKVWQLPESERLKNQTLDKLALAPWRLSGTNPPATLTNYAALVSENHSAALIRPLLEDLVQEEFYVEIRGSKDQPAQLALGIRVDSAKSGVWETNLAIVLQAAGAPAPQLRSATGEQGWDIQAAKPPPTMPTLARHVELTRVKGWTIVGLAPAQNPVFTELSARIRTGQPPLDSTLLSGATNDWMQSAFDLRRLAAAMSWKWNLPQDWPRISLNLNGDGTNLLTRGELSFARPLPFAIEPWNIPTNLIHEPLHSFTAVQGIREWVSSLAFWEHLKAGTAPNQLFCWSQSGSPFLGYAAAPLVEASGVMAKLGPAIMDAMNPMLASNRMGKWEQSTNLDGISWKAPVTSPFVQSVSLSEGKFLFASLSPYAISNSSSPGRTLAELLSHSDLVYFDREITSARTEAWMYITQLSRIVSRRVQLPGEAAAVGWFKAAGPLLRPSSTEVKKTGNSLLTLNRTSTVGLTAAELHLLGDWLESPEFPLRPHSAVAKLPPIPPRRPLGINPAPASH